jgi:zinc transport system substrate-binding protein
VLTLAALTLLTTAPLKVGVTLHPYFSWAANVTAGQPITLVPVLPGDVDAGNYQPRPEDVAKLADLDVLFVNGLGHDDFITGMVKASGNARCRVVNLNEGAALLKNAHGEGFNPHTFLSFGNAVQQTFVMARTLGQLRPELATALQHNADEYVKRLRAARADAVKRLKSVKGRRVVTVHDGYSYLLQELGLELVDVVQPAHGLTPSAGELAGVLKRLDAEPVKVVLSEEQFPAALTAELVAHGARVVVVSHIATGAFTAARFETEMQANIDALVSALSGGTP